MSTNRVSIIGDRESHYVLLDKAVRIIKDTYNGTFTIDDLACLDSFSSKEKGLLKNIFSSDITRVHAWGHSFYLDRGIWKYEESSYNYEGTMKKILLLLNNGATSIGETVHTDDYRLIENLCRGSDNLWDDEMEGVQGGDRVYEVNYEQIEFISHNLKTRVGASSEFNFEFVKSFMEAESDYYRKHTEDLLIKAIEES
jgi:hypothetical protein